MKLISNLLAKIELYRIISMDEVFITALLWYLYKSLFIHPPPIIAYSLDMPDTESQTEVSQTISQKATMWETWCHKLLGSVFIIVSWAYYQVAPSVAYCPQWLGDS